MRCSQRPGWPMLLNPSSPPVPPAPPEVGSGPSPLSHTPPHTRDLLAAEVVVVGRDGQRQAHVAHEEVLEGGGDAGVGRPGPV